ncbi:putative pyruvate, phosphate dikinase [Helianthus annuus]|nr:putative pyruvate, phosphate dikinase [Helianthus annuus]
MCCRMTCFFKQSFTAADLKDLTAADLKDLVEQYKDVYVEAKGEKFSTDPKKQLELAVNVVFDSWDSPRANKYRSINQITGLKGTVVNIQCMVFGNMGDTSGTGVLFTRNPSTGENKLYGEFLINAQGEDVVAGIRTSQYLVTMETCMPDAYRELVENYEILERHYKDMMDIEFTVQENRLWMLQCRTGTRTGKGAVTIVVEMVNEGLIDTKTAIKWVETQHLDQLLHPQKHLYMQEKRPRVVMLQLKIKLIQMPSLNQMIMTEDAKDSSEAKVPLLLIFVREEASHGDDVNEDLCND